MLASTDERGWFWSCACQHGHGTLGNRMGRSPCSSIFYDRFLQLVSGHAMVPFRHHPSGAPPSPSPILEYCPSHLSSSRCFSSTRYGPHSCPIKVLSDLTFEYSVPVVSIVSISFILIIHFLTHNVQSHLRPNIPPNPTWCTSE